MRKFTQQQINEAQSVSIVDYLASKSFFELKRSSDNIFIENPLRNDKKPSFCVSSKKNLWTDYSTKEGGNVIQLAQRIENISFVDAVKTLLGSSYEAVQPQRSTQQVESKIKIKKVQTLQNKALIQYLESRKINTEIAKKFVKECYFSVCNEKQYFALAFPTNSDSYVLRNKIWQGCSGQDITFLKGQSNKQINVFEGFMDFLSALTIKNTDIIKYDTIILNSLSNRNKVDLSEYQRINIFFDNDIESESGQKATIEVIEKYKNAKCVDYAKICYAGYNDLNDKLRKIPLSFSIKCAVCR